MNTKNNQRARLSKIMLKNAMLDLLAEKKSVEKISVRELCETAELNRSTFYAHYNEPRELLNEMEDELIASAREHLNKIGKGNDVNAYTYILSFFQYIKNNDKEYKLLLVDTTDTDFKNKFMQIAAGQIVESFDIELPQEEEQYVFSYILNGSSSVIIQWIRSGYSVDENTLVDLLFRMNKYLLMGVI